MSSSQDRYSLRSHNLKDGNLLFTTSVPPDILADSNGFNDIWNLHPAAYTQILIHGRKVPTPRWQQAYERNYFYTGQLNVALPVPDALKPFYRWVNASLDQRLNGLLVNWYDGALGHYIGPHRDSRKGLVTGSPIVTISLGEARVFRLRMHRGKDVVDFLVEHGTVVIMPWETNLAWTHQIPKRAIEKGRRVSITFRAFEI